MKKPLKNAICVAVCVAAVLATGRPFAKATFESDAEVQCLGQGKKGFTYADFLTTRFKRIYNLRGREVRLRGINLGGWLIQEEWMCPVHNAPDNFTTLTTLESRFGAKGADALINCYQDNWITEYDLDKIAALGFNCVRVPFWYRNFYLDDKGTKRLDSQGNWDFSRLEWIVRECSKRRIYVVLDLHGAPGYQSSAHHTGKADSCGLFDDTPQGEQWRKLTVSLWREIAKRFRGNPAVAMYDFLNEPISISGDGGIESTNKLRKFYDRLYDSVRLVDPWHIITMEAIWRIEKLPPPISQLWRNVVYQLHMYESADAMYDLIASTSGVWPYCMPIYVGEFRPMENATWSHALDVFEKYGYSWSGWTYKGAGGDAYKSDWFLFGSGADYESVDIVSDSYEEIMRKWGECIRTQNYTDTGHYEDLRDYLK